MATPDIKPKHPIPDFELTEYGTGLSVGHVKLWTGHTVTVQRDPGERQWVAIITVGGDMSGLAGFADEPQRAVEVLAHYLELSEIYG